MYQVAYLQTLSVLLAMQDIAKITDFKGKVLRFTAKLSTALGHKLLSHHEGGRRSAC